MSEAYIVSAVRTPGGRKGGRRRNWHPVDLAAEVLAEVVNRTGIDPVRIDDVILGCVGQIGGQAANIARNAVLSAGFPETVPATTVDQQCGSSQHALHFAAHAVMRGTMEIVPAGRDESHTRATISSAIQPHVQYG